MKYLDMLTVARNSAAQCDAFKKYILSEENCNMNLIF